MPLSCAQIVNLATQDARKPGFLSQAGQLFQMILDDLCYKFDLNINLMPALVNLTGSPTPPQFIGTQPGVGPYPLPADYLRMAQDEVIYSYQGAPQKMVNENLSVIDLIGLQQINTTYPQIFATDTSTSPPSLYVWPPPQAVVSLDIRYYRLQQSIPTPETSTTIPWFQDAMYLKSRLTGELLKPGAAAKPFLQESQILLEQFLKMEDDSEGRATIIKLDERQFNRGGGGYARLPRTKGIDF